jgi:hypothetical protein
MAVRANMFDFFVCVLKKDIKGTKKITFSYVCGVWTGQG